MKIQDVTKYTIKIIFDWSGSDPVFLDYFILQG